LKKTFQLDNAAFDLLKVSDHNYNEVENLTLNRNLLETLPEHLLEMKLGIGFSAKSNQLSSVRVFISRLHVMEGLFYIST
jgi:hypothetical protein